MQSYRFIRISCYMEQSLVNISDLKKAVDWFLSCATEEYRTPWHEWLESYFKWKKDTTSTARRKNAAIGTAAEPADPETPLQCHLWFMKGKCLFMLNIKRWIIHNRCACIKRRKIYVLSNVLLKEDRFKSNIAKTFSFQDFSS